RRLAAGGPRRRGARWCARTRAGWRSRARARAAAPPAARRGAARAARSPSRSLRPDRPFAPRRRDAGVLPRAAPRRWRASPGPTRSCAGPRAGSLLGRRRDEHAVLGVEILDQALDARLAHDVVELGAVIGDQTGAGPHDVVHLPP